MDTRNTIYRSPSGVLKIGTRLVAVDIIRPNYTIPPPTDQTRAIMALKILDGRLLDWTNTTPNIVCLSLVSPLTRNASLGLTPYSFRWLTYVNFGFINSDPEIVGQWSKALKHILGLGICCINFNASSDWDACIRQIFGIISTTKTESRFMSINVTDDVLIDGKQLSDTLEHCHSVSMYVVMTYTGTTRNDDSVGRRSRILSSGFGNAETKIPALMYEDAIHGKVDYASVVALEKMVPIYLDVRTNGDVYRYIERRDLDRCVDYLAREHGTYLSWLFAHLVF